MQPDPNDDLLYALGVDYLVVVDAQDPANPLWDPAGDVAYDVAFVARDSIQAADPVEGLQIVVRAENHRPVITDFEVSPTSGKTNATFTYTAWYYDEDNDKPVATYEGNRVEGLTLVIDPGEAYEQRWLMTRVDEIVDGGGGLPPMPVIVTYDDPDNPVKYEVAISGKQLGPGNHTFTIEGFDGTDYAVSPEGGVVVTKDGPVLLIPYFDLQVNTRDGSAVTDWAVVGEEVLVEGSMLFPFDPIGQTEPPAVINDLTIQVTKPDGTAVALNASVVDIEKDDPVDTENWVGTIEVQYDGYVDPALATGESITLTASGQWKVSAVWPGDSQWNSAATDTTIDGHNDRVEFAVSGPSRTVATSVPERPDTSSPVIDMITPPMYIGSSDPGVIFGHDRALEMQIVRWSASGNVYFRYGVSGLFPGLAPGYAVWIKPTKSYPAAEPLGISAVQRRTVFDLNVVDLADPQSVAYVSGVYLNEGLTGTNYYVASEALAGERFVHGDEQVILTTPLPIGTTQVWVKYIGYPLTGVDEGWISLDNPAVAKAIDSWGEPRYYHTNYRLIKAQSQAYPLLTDTSGNNVLDEKTKLAKLKPLSIPLEAGWNQIGNIFFNWRRSWQQGTVNVGLTSVVPSNTAAIGRVLGVYLTQSTTGNNYYEPGTAADPYRRGDGVINLTRTLPAGTSTVYVRYEAYPREDVGIPIEQIRVSYLGETKTLSEAKVAGWIHNYAFRYDSYLHDYVLVHPTMTGAERVLKAWSGYWIRAFVNCWIEIDPNTTYSGEQAAGVSAAGLAREEAAAERFDVPPPIPE